MALVTELISVTGGVELWREYDDAGVPPRVRFFTVGGAGRVVGVSFANSSDGSTIQVAPVKLLASEHDIAFNNRIFNTRLTKRGLRSLPDVDVTIEVF